MKLSDCTKSELLKLLEALQSPVQGRSAYLNKIYIERYLVRLCDQKTDKDMEEFKKVNQEITNLYPEYLSAANTAEGGKVIERMLTLMDRRDKLARKMKRRER